MRASIVSLLLVALASPAGASDGIWSELAPPCRAAHSVIYDPVRDRLLVFGGTNGVLRNDVWSLSLLGAPKWTLLHPLGTPPSPRAEHSAIYDPVGDRMLVFGGDDGSPRADVWQLSLAPTLSWTQLAPAGAPPAPRSGHSAVYDPVRHRMIVFGGQTTGAAVLNDVWALALDGSPTWSALAPAGAPPQARARASMIYDPARDQLVLFGGDQGSLYQVLGDTWTMSLGAVSAWTLIVPSGAGPDPRSRCQAIYDPQGDRMVLQGGSQGPSFMTFYDYWSLSLSTHQWTWYGDNAPLLHAAGAAYDPVRARMLVVGGSYHSTVFLNEVVALPLQPIGQWSAVMADQGPLTDHSAAFDPVRERMVVFGGLVKGYADPTPSDATWSYDPNGGTWVYVSALGTSPPAMHGHTAVFDAARDRMLVFGGDEVYGVAPVHNDVWSLGFAAGPGWAHLSPTGVPPPQRCEHSAVIDGPNDRMIVFGGSHTGLLGQPGMLNDTWAFSLSLPNTWTPITPSGTPPVARQEHTAVYDPVGQRMVVFGGQSDAALLNDVWVLSLGGAPTWTELTPAGTPPAPRFGHVAIYDPNGQRMLVFGGYTSTGTVDELWALSLGATPTWTRLVPDGASPGAPFEGSAVYDPGSRHMLVAMGYGMSGVWAFEPPGSVSIGPPNPPPAFALLGALPNPAPRDLVVAFTLPDGAPARLELFDTAGRRLSSRDVGALGPGTHRVTLAEAGRLAAGIYLLRLTRGSRSLAARAAVVR